MILWLIYALLCAVFNAGLAVLIKLGNKDLNVYTITAFRLFFMFASTLLFSLLFNKISFSLQGFTAKEWWLIIASGIFGGLGYLFYFMALNYTTASAVLSITQWTIIFAMFFLYLVVGEPISWLKMLGGLILIAGSYLIIYY